MRKIFTITFLVMSMIAYSQVPQKMSYQAIIRNASGALVTNANVGIRISILKDSATGSVAFVETHNVLTNANGLASLQIGAGAAVIGTFAAINWGSSSHFIKTETDIAGGTNYNIVSTSQLLSVPYALYAANSGNSWALNGSSVTDSNFIGTTNNKPLRFKINNTRAGIIDSTNIALGTAALDSVTTGIWNIAIGRATLTKNKDAYGSIAIGDSALHNNGFGADVLNTSEGTFNIALGHRSLKSNTIGDDNIALGHFSLLENIDGQLNIAIGNDVMGKNKSGAQNIAIGTNSLYKNTIGSYNIGIGILALSSNDTGINNIAIGKYSLYKNTSGDNNIGLGRLALANNINGIHNIAIGTSSLASNSTGVYNIANGTSSLVANTTGSANIGLGYVAAYSNSAGNNNIAIGARALYSNISNSALLAIGDSALLNSKADGNVAIGSKTLLNISIGTYNTALGFNTGKNLTSTRNNTTSIGYNAGSTTTLSNTVSIGNTSVTAIQGQVNFSTYSDKRIKTNIGNNVVGLKFISKLKPVTYNLNIKEQYKIANDGIEDNSPDFTGKYDIEKIQFSGFLAQDVEQAAKECNYNFSGVIAPQNGEGLYSLRYTEFVVPLVKALQEQQEIINQQEKKIAELEKAIKEIKAMLLLK